MSTNDGSLVCVTRERKLNKFKGGQKEESTVEDFIDDINAALVNRKMTEIQKAEYIISHLEGPAKEEVKLRPSTERYTSEKIYKILREAFGERRSLPQLLRIFYDRKQSENESLRSYSHALCEVHKRITSLNPAASTTRDQSLRDQFSDNVRDPLLRKELRRMIRVTPASTFLEVREEALRWSEEEEPQSQQEKQMPVVPHSN